MFNIEVQPFLLNQTGGLANDFLFESRPKTFLYWNGIADAKLKRQRLNGVEDVEKKKIGSS